MSTARDSSALAYIASRRHGRKRITQCGCEFCRELVHVLKLATAYVTLSRIQKEKKEKAR